MYLTDTSETEPAVAVAAFRRQGKNLRDRGQSYQVLSPTSGAVQKMKKTLVAVFACAFVMGTAALLPADLSPIGSAYARGEGGGGGHGGGHGGGNGGGHGGGMGAGNGSHGGKSNGASFGGDHAGKATRDHGVSGNRYGSDRNDDNGHGTSTSGIAHSKDTRGLSKSTAISATTPGDHNAKGLSNAVRSSSKNDR